MDEVPLDVSNVVMHHVLTYFSALDNETEQE
jgi:hypothetical protein